MNDDLTRQLTQIPEPAPSPDFAATVMARIAQAAEPQAPGAVAAPDRASVGAVTWIPALAGLAIVLGASVSAWLDAGSLVALTPARTIWNGLDLMPFDAPPAPLLIVGVLLYVAGFLATPTSTRPRVEAGSSDPA